MIFGSRLSLLPTLFLSLCTCGVISAAPPNIVMIISDDQAWTDYGVSGHPHIQTPHLDRLAGQSATFPKGYVPTSLCRPSLATLITGYYPHQHGITGNDPIPRKNRETMLRHIRRADTLAEQLGRKGYVSHQSGKWWEGNHSEGGFTAGMTHGDPKRGGRHGDQGLKIGRTGMKPITDFLDGTDGKPFFLWYAPFLPHTPHNPPERLLKKYQKPGRPLPLAKYYAMCEWFDETCGELLGELDRRGLAKNTLVVYVTDNGWIQRTAETEVPAGWRQPFAPRSKRWPHEMGVRTPIMFRWPGTIPSRTIDTRISSVDIVPTILAAADCEISDNLPGRNLLPMLKEEKAVPAVPVFGEIFTHDAIDQENPQASLMYRWGIDTDGWKLIVPVKPNQTRIQTVKSDWRMDLPEGTDVELYNLEDDPHERNNLAKSNPERVESLMKLIDEWYPLEEFAD